MFEHGATPRKATCSTHTQTEEEDAVKQEEADLAKDEADELQRIETTPNFGKKMETTWKRLEEGRTSMPVQAYKTQSNMDIARKSATTKRSVERRSVVRVVVVRAAKSQGLRLKGVV